MYLIKIMEIIASIILSHHHPRHWEMSCKRWHESRIEILQDKNLDYDSKMRLIQFFRTKVSEPCEGIFI